MLKLVLGRSGYGKTEYVFRSIKKLAQKGKKNILLITPEQFSLIAERRLLEELGESGIPCVDSSSFSRISDTVRRIYGSEPLKTLTGGSKAVIMLRAIEASKENLQLFNRRLESLNFVNSMIKIYDEMKSCNLSSEEIISLSANIGNESLRKKMLDIALIISTYELMIKDRYQDSADELTRVYNQLIGKGFFKGKEVFIDGFNGFVAQEYKLLELIISEAENITITLCSDSFSSNDAFSLFGYVNNTIQIITKIADKAGVKTERNILDVNYRTEKDDLRFLEKNIFSDNYDNYGKSENISLYAAQDITDECRQAARNIRALLRKGYRAKDIAVITRDIDKYRDELSVIFKKYEIPFFYDERQPVKNQPLVVFIEYLLRCANYSMRSDDIISLAKTGLTDIAAEDINELENYVYLWNINGLKWTKPFENSTQGFVNEVTKGDKIALERINSTRERLITPIVIFKNKVSKADVKEVCAQIYYSLINFNVDKQIKNIAVKLADSNQPILAQEQGRVWELVMEVLNQLPQALDGEKLSLKEFAGIFSMVISAEDLGTLPSGIDNVQFGQADRIRTDNPSAVFVLGANEGEFPQNVNEGGLLSESDRRILLDNDFKLYSYGEILNLQERYFAYMACCCAKEKLFVSYNSGSNGAAAPSEIAVSIKNIFDIDEITADDINDIDLIETYDNAFELMSERYLYSTPFYSSLKEYFKDDERFGSIVSLVENRDIEINDKKLSTSLFSYNMYVSASRVEDFYNCSFRYFCKFGLNAKPRKKAEIDPMQRGTLIHYVLEMILSTVGSRGLSELTEAEIASLVDKFTREYFVNEMGSAEGLSVRFKYNYRRLSNLIYSVVVHLAQEFANSDFEAKAFELGIDKDGQVKPEILSLDDGGTIQIRGSIDRVDTYEKDGERFVRVVDYKSGNKSFNLSDIMHGLNLQMFIYLFSLCEDKKAEFTGTPAGVLYMHSARNIFSFDSKSSAVSNIECEENSSFKMKGIVLEDENGDIANAMEHDIKGRFIPVKMKKNGELSGKLASLQELGLIHKKINSLVADMGMQLHLGKIHQNPFKDKNHKNTCDFCDYKDVCANRRSIENRIAEDLTDSMVKEELAKEFENNA